MSKEEFKAFVSLVSQMRTAQAEYFRNKSPQWLGKAKELEGRVDRQLKEFSNGQGKLFERGDPS